jgi:hypothetical protein
MAARNGKLSRLLLFRLLFVLDNLPKNAGHFVGRLTLLKKSNELKWVHGHHLVCIHKLKLMRLGLHKEVLFTLLLRSGYLDCSMEVATVKIADELNLMPHELMHWHEGRFFGSTKPADQLIANIGEPWDCLKVIPDAFVEVCLCMVCNGGALLGSDVCPFSQTYILKTLTHQVKQCWTIVLPGIQKSSQIFLLEIGERERNEVLSPKSCLVRHNVSCDFLAPFSKKILIQSGCFEPFLIRLSVVPLAPKDVQQVYQLHWGVFCDLMKSDIVTILACLGLDHVWVLIACLLDRTGISTQQRTIVIVTNTADVAEWLDRRLK